MRGRSRKRKAESNPHEVWLTADGIGQNGQVRHLLIYQSGGSFNILDEFGFRHPPERPLDAASQDNVRRELEENFKITNLRLTSPKLEHLRTREGLDSDL